MFDINFLLFSSIVEVGRSSYRAMYDIFYHPEKIGASVEVFRTAGNEKVAEMEAIYENTGEKYYTKFLVRLKVLFKA